jgi:hypothetical protein
MSVVEQRAARERVVNAAMAVLASASLHLSDSESQRLLLLLDAACIALTSTILIDSIASLDLGVDR